MFKFCLFISLLFSLTGCLPAIFTATTASTVTIAKDQPISESMHDIKISTKIKAALMKSNFRELYTKIKVEVEQGRVLYTGMVDKEEDALKAVQLAWDIPEVVEVINELVVDKNSNHFDLAQYTKDSMITSQIKAKTFINRGIKFVNYTVITLNNTVYLFGIARSEEELEKVTTIAAQIRGVEKVISHVKIIEHFVNGNVSKESEDSDNENIEDKNDDE